MNIATLDNVIRQMCEEVSKSSDPQHCWDSRSEEDLLYEIAVCILSSQVVFEMAVACADALRAASLFCKRNLKRPDYEGLVLETLSKPVTYLSNDTERKSLPRFKNRLSRLLSLTALHLIATGTTIKSLLKNAESPTHARQQLVDTVFGFGPKQASLFLRRIGYCDHLAIIDTHIIDYLNLAKAMTHSRSRLSSLPYYQNIEEHFRQIADEFGFSVGCVDLAMWITMRVAKREAYL
jgi:N-glycosylase/DNA lyase